MCATWPRHFVRSIWPCFIPDSPIGPAWIVGGSCLLLALVTGAAVWRVRAQPYLAVGWFWFLGMLVPVIGLVQIGGQSMADDRYDYLPGIGLSIMFVWAARDWIPPSAARLSATLGWLAIVACMAATWRQAGYWANNETLFGHAIAVTKANGIMESNLGIDLFREGRTDDALPHLRQGVALTPNVRGLHHNLANALLAKGLLAEGFAEYEIYVNEKPGDPVSQFSFGNVLLDHDQLDDAIIHLQKAVELRPDVPEYHYKLANAFSQSGRAAEAITQYDLALQSQPDYIQACNNLAWILASNPNPALRNGAKAVALAARADQLSRGRNPVIQGTLAMAYAETGKFPEAIATARHALQLAGPESASCSSARCGPSSLFTKPVPHIGKPAQCARLPLQPASKHSKFNHRTQRHRGGYKFSVFSVISVSLWFKYACKKRHPCGCLCERSA